MRHFLREHFKFGRPNITAKAPTLFVCRADLHDVCGPPCRALPRPQSVEWEVLARRPSDSGNSGGSGGPREQPQGEQEQQQGKGSGIRIDVADDESVSREARRAALLEHARVYA